ncbi:MAG: ATP-binding cassette domain-containing protein [Pigmentiphaga sp.]|nr:ATP-binding cassette domain-containing protein [Pigmentiphaga sp.]
MNQPPVNAEAEPSRDERDAPAEPRPRDGASQPSDGGGHTGPPASRRGLRRRWWRGTGRSDATAVARKEIYRTLGRALWRFRRRTLLALVLLIAAKLMMVAVPVVLKLIVDGFGAPAGMAALPLFLLIGYSLLRFGGGLFTELRDMAFIRVTQTTVADFNLRVFEHLHKLGARFHAGRQTGALSRDVERGTAGVAFLLGTALFTLLPTLVEIVSVVIILISSYRLTFAGIVGVTFILYAIVTVVFTARRMIFQRQLNEYDSLSTGRLVDSLLNYETVKLYNNQPVESERLRDTLMRWVAVGIDNQRALSALHVAQSAMIALGVAAVMLLAGQEVLLGRMTVGDLVLVNAYIIQICLPLSALGLVFRQTKEAFVNAEKVGALLNQPEEPDAAVLPELVLGRGEIRFENVDFSYEPGRQILWGVDFVLAPGKTVAVVGGSGSGKSTLARLLFRFYDADSGSVSVDGQDVREVDARSLRAVLGIVPQDTVLFNETIAYNIAYGKPGSSLSDVIEAAKGARVHDFIQGLPAQYDTLVGERGVKLSGGERQRIAIARALLKNPPILIFDEATSALDSRTERAIQGELERISQGRTTLVIAHRLSTVVNADDIIVLEQGRVVEHGTHAQLLATDGIYAQMWSLQRQQNALEAAGARIVIQPLNLATLVAGVVDVARGAIDEKELNLYSQIEVEGARVMADPATLRDVVWTICFNAIAVTPPGGRIGVRLARQQQRARLTVTDARIAPGLAAQQAEDDSVWNDAGARPLDPNEIQAAVAQAGGVFGWDTVPGGHGLAYWLELPLASPRERAKASGPAAASLHALSGARIALLDPDADSRAVLVDILQSAGATAIPVATGAQFIALVNEGGPHEWPDAIVCDLALPDMDGYALVTRLRELEAEREVPLGRRVPAIAISRQRGEHGRLQAIMAGFQAHVSKPVEGAGLLARINAVLDGRRERRGSGPDGPPPSQVAPEG